VLPDYRDLVRITDACDPAPTASQFPAPGTGFNGHGDLKVVVLTATDASGNASTCAFTVTAVDDTPPVITDAHCDDLSTTLTLDCNDPDGYAYWPSVDENCSYGVGIYLEGSTTPLPGGVIPYGPHTNVLVLVEDEGGNTATCVFNAEVVGDTPGPLRAASQAEYDGQVIETSSLDPLLAGTGDTAIPNGYNITVGDTAGNLQTMGVLSFDVSSLPTNAIITGAYVRLTRTQQWGEPLDLGMLRMDLSAPSLGDLLLEPSDFEAPAMVVDGGWPTPIPPGIGATMEIPLKPSAVNLLYGGSTVQCRLRFSIPTDNDKGSDGLVFASGEYGPGHPWTPEMVVLYYLEECLGCGEQPADPGTPDQVVTVRSSGLEDGHVEESQEDSSVGDTTSTRSQTISVGDTADDRQVLGLLSFDTSSIPDDAYIVSAQLALTRSTKRGDPQDLTLPLGDLVVDMRCVLSVPDFYGAVPEVESGDFQAFSRYEDVTAAPLTYPATNGALATGMIKDELLSEINKAGLTQFKVRFALEDNDNSRADQLLFFSGDMARIQAYQPSLTVTYRTP